MSDEQKQSDEELRAEMLVDTVDDPPLAVQLELKRQSFSMWSNSYFSARDNFRVAHETGLPDLEQFHFDQAKRFRDGVLRFKQEIEDLEKQIAKERGNGLIQQLAEELDARS